MPECEGVEQARENVQHHFALGNSTVSIAWQLRDNKNSQGHNLGASNKPQRPASSLQLFERIAA
jgi:hypothetical protein